MKFKKFMFSVLLMPGLANAGVHCTEVIKSVVLHQNGNVYFTSSKTCNSWCQIKWTGDGDKDRAYSQLLAARTTNREITFYWRNLSSCDTKNPTYQSPEYMVY